MIKRFNITGLCVPHKHYMVDISEKLRRMKVLVDNGDYFTINRARQYGKTTTLAALRELIKDEYLVISISFERMTDERCESTEAFCSAFMHVVRNSLINTNVGMGYADKWIDKSVTDFISLGQHIKRLCGNELPEPYTKVVLMIDEVDKVSNVMVFLGFLGMLRDKFQLQQQGRDISFHSVILASVEDINDIRFMMQQQGYNFSPWNIAVPFNADMSFSTEEISTMLAEYENDHNTGMDIVKISDEIYSFTSGYPYLVSRLCQCIDEGLNKEWTTDGVAKAVNDVLNEKNTLFDVISEIIEANKELSDFLYEMLVIGRTMLFHIYNPVINLAWMHGIVVDRDGKASVANRIFEIYILLFIFKTKETVKQV